MRVCTFLHDLTREREVYLEKDKGRLPLKYATIVCCRNEEQYIDVCINAILNQTLPPDLFLVMDDGSTDSTREIVARYPCVKLVSLNYPRSKVRGVNTVQALNVGINLIAESGYTLIVDADTVLPINYARSLIDFMEEHADIGVISGFPETAKFSYEHVPNGARIYRWECIKKIGQIPPITGFDSWLKFKIKQLGYEVRGYDIRYKDMRPGRAQVRRHYFWGRASYLIGQPLLIVVAKAFRSLKHKPPVLSSLVYFFSYLAHRLTGWRLFTAEYYSYVNDYFKRLVCQGVRRGIKLIE